MLYEALRACLFRLDPEAAHELAVRNAIRLQDAPQLLRWLESLCEPPPSAAVEVFGLKFRSPIGIAAGFDKSGEMLGFLSALGFGFLEIGTVTARPQSGNPRPRLFRYPDRKALVNRMGFNNDGAAVVAQRVRAWRETATLQPPLFVNIGKNRDVPLGEAAASYAACAKAFASVADACVLNVSSPNTPSLRELQRPEHLVTIIEAVRDAGFAKPLLVKIAPDLDEGALSAICAVTTAHADGMICTNTTIERPPGIDEAGGLSGAPLRPRSTAILARVRGLVGAKFSLIGVGGVFTPDDVVEKLAAGADLVQLYTGFIYEGPLVARRLARALAERRPPVR